MILNLDFGQDAVLAKQSNCGMFVKFRNLWQNYGSKIRSAVTRKLNATEIRTVVTKIHARLKWFGNIFPIIYDVYFEIKKLKSFGYLATTKMCIKSCRDEIFTYIAAKCPFI